MPTLKQKLMRIAVAKKADAIPSGSLRTRRSHIRVLNKLAGIAGAFGV
ncbi:hypothetical protein [Caproicibacter fermentans]|uniref:Uncharacterized protein n=1 Tax=Caproicibacter fermentans TaxID=2576756 RepID=A0A7G8TDN3_9FIRM|nr:hypothetical protein [Caproicibacter fermentans]QNK41724.1 hypothetical protein HCR03_05605 [Caproicibacter fermentans]